MKIYILLLSLVIIFLKYKISKKYLNKNNSNSKLKLFNKILIPLVIIVIAGTFYQDAIDIVQTGGNNDIAFSYVYTEPANF